MPTNKKSGSTREDLQYEELILREAKSAKERREVEDFNDEIRAIDIAEANGEEASQTLNGKMITGRSGSSKHHHRHLSHIFSSGGFIDATKSIASGLIDLAVTGLMMGSKNPSSRPISAQFVDTASQRAMALQPAHEDENFLYDTMNVSRPVFEKLMKESEIIAKKLEEAEAIKDSGQRVVMLQSVEKLAEEFEMRIHPLTKVYVHDYNRVLREEQACEAANKLNHQHTESLQLRVCYYRAKAELSDLRGIKSKVADQFDNTPEEVQVSGDHLKGHAPALTPNGP